MEGYTGRECPNPNCEGYFKIVFGTGFPSATQCYCPYCGHAADQSEFATTDQNEYAKSVFIRKVTEALAKDLKSLEFDIKPRGPFGIGVSMKVKADPPPPIHRYRERQLETHVECHNCTLKYAVYGVFAFCPNCGQHNSDQVLERNLEVVSRMLDMAAGRDVEVAAKLVENALEDCISAFDGFGRELCRVYARKSSNPSRAEKVSFQNLEGARRNVQELFGADVASALTADEWKAAAVGFQKRHLFAHRMGVIDADYVQKTGDLKAVVGRKVGLGAEEVRSLVKIVAGLAGFLARELGGRPSPEPQ